MFHVLFFGWWFDLPDWLAYICLMHEEVKDFTTTTNISVQAQAQQPMNCLKPARGRKMWRSQSGSHLSGSATTSFSWLAVIGLLTAVCVVVAGPNTLLYTQSDKQGTNFHFVKANKQMQCLCLFLLVENVFVRFWF